jgi:tRNA threonylcarbamoyladenosine biosynthesis protein TsaB
VGQCRIGRALSGLAGAPFEAFGQFCKMPSLSHILRDFSPLLLIDASSERIQAGLLSLDAPPRWAARSLEAGVGVFECLDELDVDIDSVRSFAFCEGPGSILGIRTSAMALRMWNVLRPRPMFSYVGLAVVARALGRPGVTFIADARRGLWHRLTMGESLERVPAAELTGELMTPEGFRRWDPLPEGTATTPYDLASLLALPSVTDANLFREAEAPDAFLHQEPEYAKWAPQIHRAP